MSRTQKLYFPIVLIIDVSKINTIFEPRVHSLAYLRLEIQINTSMLVYDLLTYNVSQESPIRSVWVVFLGKVEPLYQFECEREVLFS